MAVLDMKHVNMKALSSDGVFNASTKKKATTFARQHGWTANNVVDAQNRFFRFWVVGQMHGTDTFRVLNKDGTWTDFPFRGFI